MNITIFLIHLIAYNSVKLKLFALVEEGERSFREGRRYSLEEVKIIMKEKYGL